MHDFKRGEIYGTLISNNLIPGDLIRIPCVKEVDAGRFAYNKPSEIKSVQHKPPEWQPRGLVATVGTETVK